MLIGRLWNPARRSAARFFLLFRQEMDGRSVSSTRIIYAKGLLSCPPAVCVWGVVEEVSPVF